MLGFSWAVAKFKNGRQGRPLLRVVRGRARQDLMHWEGKEGSGEQGNGGSQGSEGGTITFIVSISQTINTRFLIL